MATLTAALTPYTADQIDGWNLRTYDVRQGRHPTERRQVGNNTRDTAWLCDWSAREDVIRYFLGDVGQYRDPATGETKLTRLLPQRHPQKPEMVAVRLDEMYGLGCGIDEAFGDPGYETAVLRFTYEHVPFDVLEDDDEELETEWDRYVWFQPGQGTAEALTLPGGCLKYTVQGGVSIGNPEPHLRRVPFNVSKVFPVTRFKLSVLRLPFDAFGPGSVIWDRLHGTGEGDNDGIPWVGCINAAEFQNCPTGTLLLESFEAHIERSPLATGREWSIDFNFAFKPTGWNWLPWLPTQDADQTTAGLYMVATDGVFATADVVEDFRSLHNSRDFLHLLDLDPS